MSADPQFVSMESVYFLNGFIWEAFPGHAFTILLTLISFFGTTNIVIATWKTKSLHGICNYLLALNAISDSIHQCAHFLHGYIIFFGIDYLPRIQCVYLNTIPLFGLNSGMITVFVIGIDRLFSVLFPTTHRKLDKKLYFFAFFSINATFNLIIFFTVYDYALQHPLEKTKCSIPDVLGGYSSDVWFFSCIVLNLATMLCYIIVWILLKYNKNAFNPTRKLFKAIAFIMLTIFFGWTVNAIFRICISYFKFQQRSAFILSVYFGIFVNIACASNYFILLKFSYDYQIVFKQYLNVISKPFTRKHIFDVPENALIGISVAQRRTTFTLN